MRLRPALLLALVLAFAAAGCGGDDEEGEASDCGPAPAAMSGSPSLPADFPTPDGVTYTEEREAGPSTIVEGFRNGDLEEAFDAYKTAFEEAGYDVTRDEQEEDDAEVNFAGGGTDGQVRLRRDCEDRTAFSITIRPT